MNGIGGKSFSRSRSLTNSWPSTLHVVWSKSVARVHVESSEIVRMRFATHTSRTSLPGSRFESDSRLCFSAASTVSSCVSIMFLPPKGRVPETHGAILHIPVNFMGWVCSRRADYPPGVDAFFLKVCLSPRQWRLPFTYAPQVKQRFLRVMFLIPRFFFLIYSSIRSVMSPAQR